MDDIHGGRAQMHAPLLEQDALPAARLQDFDMDVSQSRVFEDQAVIRWCYQAAIKRERITGTKYISDQMADLNEMAEDVNVQVRKHGTRSP